jgi:YD repeat-containing protein
MVAVVNGSGLGLFTSNGSTGAAGLGQSRERVFVNSTTGNLVIQDVDELLTANGNDFGLTRTYNSLGFIDGDNNDGWRMGVFRSLNIVGSPTAPDRIIKTFGDGAQITYTLNGTSYRSTDGDGAHDTLQLVSGQWIWKDGSGQNTETYNASGQILNSKDADGNAFTYGYTNSLVTTITIVSPPVNATTPQEGGDGSTTTISLDYLEPTGRKLLQRVRVTRTGTPEQTLTTYGYDTSNRLQTVTVDLTPENGADASTYVTTYGYDGTSNRVASITQRAGGTSNVTASVSFGYDLLDGDYRLTSYTDGEGHKTIFTYSQVNGGGGTSTTLPANGAVLQTTETQNVSNNYTLNPSAVSTTDTQTSTNTYNVNNSQITTGATQTDSYNRNNAALSTTDTQTSTTNYNVNSAQITTGATQTTSYNRNDAALSTTDTQATTTNYNVNSAQLTTNATQTNTYNRNAAALSTTDTTTTTNAYNLNAGALTTPAGGGSWSAQLAFDSSPLNATDPKVAFDANGNGFAVWSHVYADGTADLVYSRYTRSTNTWGAQQQVAFSPAATDGPVASTLAMDSAGNALMAYVLLNASSVPSLYVRRYDAATSTWSSPAFLATSTTQIFTPSLAINGAFAAVSWGTWVSGHIDLTTSRLSGSSWLAATAMETSTAMVASDSTAIDNQGNINVVFVQGTSLYCNRYTASTSSWSGATSIATGSISDMDTRLDGNGNGFAVWAQGTDLMMSRYTRSTNTWSAPTALDSLGTAVERLSLAMDSAGNALVAWAQSDGTAASVYARRYDVASSAWSAATGLESSSIPADSSLIASIQGNTAGVLWNLSNPTTGATNAYAATLNGSTWSAATLLGVGGFGGAAFAVDPLGNATAIWQPSDANLDLSIRRFTAGSGGAPYYTVPAGATWQSVANALYGINSAAAGTALQTAMANPALTTGAQLTGWPATLSVTTTTTITVPAYYNVPAGATWQSIANAVYGINSAAAGTALQTAMGNPALSTGLHLTGFPATLSVTTTLAAHYLVPASATWQSIANTLYGVNSAAAGSALQTALGNPSIAAGQRLFNIPATLAVTTTATVTVPPYYLVPAAATWQSIANAVYGVNSAAAGSALQTALGNPALTTGAHLTGFPPTLSITTTYAPHYLVPASATWQSIANMLYGVNSAAAGSALQTALGNPSIAAGTRLFSIPATLAVTTTATVTVPAYYTIPSGATWQSIANAVYGVNSAAAGTALRTAMGNPTLTVGNRLTNFPATISVVTSLAAHYLVPTGATWQSVANTLYGVNNAAAGTALQTALGNPALAAGARLYSIPATLTVTTTSTITVPAYYVIPSSPSWQSIANTLYGINSAAAGSALQAALGNPTLTPGNRLTSLPTTLTVVTQQTVTVAPYYVVPTGATWTSITQAVYGTSVAAAVSALQAGTGNPTLTTNLHLTVPANLTYSTASASGATRLNIPQVVTQETVSVPHSNGMTATLETTHLVMTPTDFHPTPTVFQTSEVQPVDRVYNLTGASTTASETHTFPLVGALSYPPKGWGVVPAQTIAGSTATVSTPKVEYDSSGNGIAVWTTTVGSTVSLRWARYTAATKTWGAMQSQVIASASPNFANAQAMTNFSLAVDSVTGQAVLGWAQQMPFGLNNGATLPSGTVYASIFNPSTGTWSTPTNIGIAIREFYVSVAMRNGIAAVSYTTSDTPIQNNGTGNDTSYYREFCARFNGSTWTAGVNLTGTYSGQAGVFKSAVTVESDNSIHVVWCEGSVSGGKLVEKRWNGSAWVSYADIDSLGAVNTVVGKFGANGDGIIAVGSAVYRYVKATGTWTKQTVPTPGQVPVVDIDESGRAIIAAPIGQVLSVYTFDGTSWSAAQLMSNVASINSISVSMRGGRAIVSWNEVSGSNGIAYARTFENGVWGTVQAIGTSIGGWRPAAATLDTANDMHVLWAAGTSSTSFTLTDNRFISSINAPGYIALDGDPTWREVATQMYGQNYAEAGEALRVAMGSPTLQPSGTLSGFPTQLTFTANFPSAPYYDIPDGNLQTAANALYFNSIRSMPSPEGGLKLQELVNSGVITRVGNHLTGLPATITLTAPETVTGVPAYYIVPQSVTTWRQLAFALYGIDSDRAGDALQAAMSPVSLRQPGLKLMRSEVPDTITVGVDSMQPTPAFFKVTSSTTTWTALAQALYNITGRSDYTVDSPARAGAALQTAMAAQGITILTAGDELRGMPATLTYNTTRVDTVTPYYIVQSGDTWLSIVQLVYGTLPDPAAATALQTALNNQALTAGTHLLVPASINYVPTLGTSTVYQSTDVTDVLGLTTTYKTSVQGRLISTLSPTVGGVRIETRYDYDLDGNVTGVTLDPGGLNRVTSMTYDANGNLASSRDSAGNTVTRFYDPTTNLLTSETVYLVPDPDGFGGQAAQSPLTTRYFYDGEAHLRFVVSPDGRVVEHQYFQAGTRQYTRAYGGTAYAGTFSLAALTSWAANRSTVELTQYSYDFRGNLATLKRFETTDLNGVGTGTPSVTTFVYDPRGNLLSVIDPRGTGTSNYKTSYVYDGLGRLTQKVEWLSATDTRTTLSTFDDANRGIVTKISSTLSPLGRVTTTSYDRSGSIVTIANADTSGASFGSTLFAYDADNRLRMTTDAMGVRSYALYDTLGRKSGEVDADGRLTRYVYNRAGQVVKAVRYSSLLSSTALATLVSAGVPANVTVDSLVATLTLDATKDQTTRFVYDKAGRLVYSIDAGGFVTQSFYDGASRIIDVVRFATGITVAASVDELDMSAVNVAASANDRRQRNFYNGDGMLIGTLDAAGYLIEFVYDSLGHLQRQTAYANPTTVTDRANGSFATLKTSADDDAAHDINSWFWYDAQGRTIGVLDAEGYLTETKYDLAGNILQKIRYEKFTTWDASLTTVRNAATGAKNQTTAFGYDGAGRLISQTNFEGTLSGFQYNALDEVISATTGDRTVQKRYNAMGWVTQELSGEGSAQITGGMTQAQIDAIWSQWAITHTYDNAGHRKSTTDQYGNKTFFYYDVDGRVRYTVRDLGNGTGEASEARYNALGQVTDTITHSTRINTSGLVGGLVDATITSAVTNDATDAHGYLTYKLTGAVASSRNQEGAQTDYTYDAFGAITNKFEKVSASVTTEHRYTYDSRGLLTNTRWDATGINRSETRLYDAFGRLKSTTDQYGRSRSSDYDRLGHVVATHGGITGEDARFEYDLFDRVVKSYDAYNNLTSYSYDDLLKRSIMTTPEGVTVTTTHDPFGATLSVIDSDGRGPVYTYNKDGQVLSISDGGGALETRTYDRAGRLDTSKDGRNVVTRFAYDAASRLFTRTVDEGGLALQTKYEYDGQGRIMRVTEPGGRITETSYYTDGRVKQLAVDPAGLNLRTYFEYDLAGSTTKKTEGYGSTAARTTSYVFDNLGRRIEEIVDPTGLNLHTQYKYDLNGNVSRKIDASGYSTWYVYDADNRLVYTVNALGAVSKQTYDLNGRVIATANYAAPTSTATFGDVVMSVSPTTSANDRLNKVVFDRNGRVVYTIDALGIVNERTYDASGNVTRTLTYSRAIPVGGTYTTIAAVQTALNTAGNTAGTVTANDQVVYRAYDTRGRAIFAVDALGDVVRSVYDAANNLLETRQYATTYSGAKTLAALNAWATGGVESNSANRITRHRYDNAGREKYTIDGAGAVIEYTYDALGNVTRQLQYYRAVPASGTYDTFAQITTALGGAGNVAGSVSAADRVQWTAYDAAGRAEFKVDSIDGTSGAVQRVTYDSVGNVVLTQSFKTQRGLSLATDVATLRTWANNNSDTSATGDEFTAFWYDAAGRQRYQLDAEGYFNEIRYNDANNSVSSIMYAVGPASHGLTRSSTYAQVNAAAGVAANGVGARVVTLWRDAAGRERFALDGERYLTEIRYNDAALQQTRYVYGAQLAVGRLASTSTLTDVAGVAAAPDVAGGAGTGNTLSSYDADGRLARVTYSLDGSHEDFGYDVYGNKTSYSNQKGSVWTYQYDAGGNLREERTPTVQATTITSTGDAATLTQIPEAVVIITRLTYNAFGNVATRTEGIRLVGGTENPAGSRTTSYGYDNAGRQTSTTLPTFAIYAPPANDEINTDTATMRRETSVTPTTTTTYDAFGNAVMNVDVGGAYSRKAYDNLGRVIYEVDALSYVTRYGYDTFGNKITGTRFAAVMSVGSLGSAAVWTRANITDNLVTGSSDRTATNFYDRRNLQVRVLQPATDVFVTQPNVAAGSAVTTAAGESKYTYDAFGQVTKYQALIDPSTSKYAETYFFYDGKGQQTATVDSQGFVTTQEFDARGNVTRVVEFAQALTGSPPWNPASVVSTTPATAPNAVSGYDRDTRMAFDSLGRMVSRSLLNVETATVSGGNVTTSPQTQTTTYTYDAVGNRTSETNAAGTTYTFYDVLGRTTAQVEPTRNVDGAGTVNVTPLTEMYRDVYGNLVREVRYANSATAVSASGYTKPAGTVQESLVQYDLYGHAIRTTDSVGANRYASYDVRGNVAKEWQPVTNADNGGQTLVTIHEYDALGHETATITPARRSDTLWTTVGATRADTMRLSQNYNPPLWTGENVVKVTWPPIPAGGVRVQIQYIQYSRNQGNGPTVTRTETFSGVTQEGLMRWTDSESGAYAGVLQILSVSVISIVNGVETPLGSQAAFYLSVGYVQSVYNAFGEVTKQGTNNSRQNTATGNFQVLNEYDNAGHLWRTNADDGVRRIYYYDAAGRRTGEVRSQQNDLTAYNPSTALALSATQSMRMETVYDGLDQVVERRFPSFAATNGAGAPSQKLKLDRWGNSIESTDAGGQTTNYRYNVLGGLVESKQPTVSILNTKVSLTASNGRPTLTNYYDVLGRLIATRDGNSNLNSTDLNAAGQVLAERHADGGVKTYAYDAFGNQTLVVNELGNWTVQAYDSGNRLIRVQTQLSSAPDGLGGYTRTYITRDFGFDGAGRRISETSGETMVDGTPETTKYFYDNNGNVSSRRSPMGNSTWYEYDIFGNLIGQEDAVGGKLIWSYDAFGHVTGHTDMGGVSTTYTYDRAALLDTQISTAGQNLNNDYDAAGHLITITDTGVGRVTTFGYDTAGRRSREKTVINGRTHQDVAITYDALNRMSTLTDLRYSLTYTYDAQGNRTRTNGTALDSNNVSQVSDLWYTYDSMNRVKLSQTENIGGFLAVNAKQGAAISYDLAGRRTETDQYGTDMLQKVDNWNSSTQQHEISYRDRFGYYRETYSYDDSNRLTFVARSGEFQNLVDGRESGLPVPLALDAAVTRTYDKASRVIQEDVWRVDAGTTVYTYDDDGHAILQTVRTIGSTTGVRQNETEFRFDAAGVLRSYDVTGFDRTLQGTEQQRYIAGYTNGYLAGDTYLMTDQHAVQVFGPDAPLLGGLTTRGYNVNRELVSQTDTKSTLSNRWFFNNANGESVTVVGGPSVNTSNLDSVVAAVLNGGGTTYRGQHFFYANGESVGSFGLVTRGDPNDATARANFDVNFTKALDQVSPTLAPEAIVHAGDTLRTIAARYMGDSNLWYLVAEENGLSNPDAVLAAGLSLRLPNKVVSLSNNANVFKPFNAQSELGDITPFMKVVWKPPGPDRCAQAAMLVVVIAFVVISGEYGLLLDYLAHTNVYSGISFGGMSMPPFFSALFREFIQGGIATLEGQHYSINWRSVAAQTVSSAILDRYGGKISSLAGRVSSSGIIQKALTGVVKNAITQGVNIALKNQDGFNWREAAVAGVTAPINSAIQNSNFAKTDGGGQIASFLTGVISSAGQTWASRGRINVFNLVADGFGNVIVDDIARVSASVTSSETVGNGSSSSGAGGEIPAVVSLPNPGDDNSISDTGRSIPGSVIDADGVDPDGMQYVVVTGVRSGGTKPSAAVDSLHYGRTQAGVGESRRVHVPTAVAALVTNLPSNALTMRDMVDALNRLQANPLQPNSADIQLYDQDSKNYVFSTRGKNVSMTPYGAGWKIEDFEKREALRAQVWEADESTPNTDADLIARFPDGMSKSERLDQILRITGGHFTVDTAINLLEQINSGRSFVDLTEARGQSMEYLEYLKDKSGIVQQTWKDQLQYNVHDVSSMQVDSIVASRLGSWRETDHLLPPLSVDINTRGIVRTWNSADLKANLALTLVDAAAAVPMLLARGGRTLDAGLLRFSQDSVSFAKTRGGIGYTFDDIFNSMKVSGWRRDLDNLDVVRMPDGLMTSIDNTRLLAAQQLGIEVRVNVREFGEALPAGMARFNKPSKDFFPKTWGEVALNRIQSQSSKFARANPYGSFSQPVIKGRPQ